MNEMPDQSYPEDSLQKIIEGALLAAGKPLSIVQLQSLFGEEHPPAKDVLQAVLEDIQADCRGRGFELKQVSSGWRFQVPMDLNPWVSRLWEEKPQKYSRAMLETLSLIAYRQPITRGDIEEIRGVAVSSHIMKTLMERGWVRVVGHRDVPGRPAMFATTREFLDYFNLQSLEQLPTLAEIRDLDSINEELDFAEAAASADDSGEEETDAAQMEILPDSIDDSEESEVIGGSIASLPLGDSDPAIEETDVEEMQDQRSENVEEPLDVDAETENASQEKTEITFADMLSREFE